MCSRLEKRIRGRVKSQMEKSQREYYLNEQMKAIQKELGELEDAPNETGGPGHARMAEVRNAQGRGDQGAAHELNKLKQMSPMSAEAAVVRNYRGLAGGRALESAQQGASRICP
jgi:ATP-dependent Lon protease